MTIVTEDKKVEPVAMRLLVEHFKGAATVAVRIGVSDGLINTSLRENSTRLVYELACEKILFDETQTSGASLPALISGIREHFQKKSILDVSPQELELLNRTLREILR